MISEEFWDDLWIQLVSLLVLIAFSTALESALFAKPWIRQIRIHCVGAGVTFLLFYWWDWKVRVDELRSTVIDVDDEEIVRYKFETSLFAVVPQQSIRHTDLREVIESPLGWTLFEGVRWRRLFLPKEDGAFRESVASFLRRVPPGVPFKQETFRWWWLAAFVTLPLCLSLAGPGLGIYDAFLSRVALALFRSPGKQLRKAIWRRGDNSDLSL